MIKIQFDVPKSMIAFCNTTEAREKPYDICLQCPFIRESCDGPNILAMDYPRWAEWARERIKQIEVSRQEIAEISGLSVSTLASALSGSGYDIKTDTMRRVTKAIIGGCWGQYPCHFASLLMKGVDLEDNEDGKKVSELEAEIEQLRAELKKETESTEARIQEAKKEAQTKIDYLKEQVNIRDKYLAEKNQIINDLMTAVIGKKE